MRIRHDPGFHRLDHKMDYVVKVNTGFGSKAEIPTVPISQVFVRRMNNPLFCINQ